MGKNRIQGHILEIQRMSTEDGPGLRTTLFMKGCPLHCPWCHNPESISTHPQVQWFVQKCIGCHTCIPICRNSALRVSESNGIAIDQQLCTGCGMCVDICPTTALQLFGYYRDAEETADELLKDLAYFRGAEDGGITISGGEAALQPDFVHEVFKRIKAAGVSTALDTCGVCSREALETAAEYADIILFDLKICNQTEHRTVVGGDFTAILDNLRRVADMHKRIWLRTPIIPGFTDSKENITGLAQKAAGILEEFGTDSIERWELCAFNDLCADKYHRLSMPWALEGRGLMRKEEMESLVNTAISAGFPADRICWTGMTVCEKGDLL